MSKPSLKPIRRGILWLLERLRTSPARRPILRLLVWLHNTAYHMISFFATDPGGVHPKHDIQRYHQFFCDNTKAQDRVLDIGCGTGEVAFAVSQLARSVVGIDFSSSSIQKAMQKFKRSNLSFLVGDATTHPFGEKFDVIILSNVLEHIEDRTGLLQKLLPLASRLLIRVPMLTRDWITVYKKNEGFEYRLDDTHYLEYTEADMRRELLEAGWRIVSEHVSFGELYVVAEKSLPAHDL